MQTVKLKPKCKISGATFIFWSLTTAVRKSSNNWQRWAFKYMKVVLLMEEIKNHTVVELLQEEKPKTKFQLKNNPIPPYYSVQYECDLQKWILFPLTVQVYIEW